MIHYFFKYFPKRIKNVGEDAVNAQDLIFAFRDGEAGAYEEIAQMTAEWLKEKYGEDVSNIIIVCVPTSDKDNYNKRFQPFCQRLCELCKIKNGFPYVCILDDRKAVHKQRHGKNREEVKLQPIFLDEKNLKGKKVCIFDDIITTGKSFSDFASQLENVGAIVVGGVFVGKTFYKYD